MTDPIRLAFAHPLERAEATSETPLDRISVRDMVIEVEIGAFQAERGTTQRVRFNVVVEVEPLTGPIADDVDRILSYDRVTEAIEVELAAERLNLLETLAERVADRILIEPQAKRCFVRIEKLDRGPGNLGVEIVRTDRALTSLEENTPHPTILYLTNAAISSAQLTQWLDQLDKVPAILVVGANDAAAPVGQHRMVQRRIDLLALEQNAWVLAGYDDRCVVVGSRTELDWGLRNGQLSVWAPSKMVLDAVDGLSVAPSDGKALAVWLAQETQARAVVFVGTSCPDQGHQSMCAVGVETTELPL